MMVRLEAGAGTVHWGYLDAALPAVATVDSGDVVTISTVSGPPEVLPPPPAIVPQALHDIHNAKARRMLPGHMCTGPVAVRGARPGQVLQVDIEDVALHYDWGYTAIRPLRGALPYDFPEPQMIHVALERNRMVGRLPWGTEIPLRPFFGVMANAPPRSWGTVSSIQPRQFGGNMDNKELTAGTSLYLPVFVENALFSVGDGHAAQGDGEVCVNAIETGLIGRFRLVLRDDMTLAWPMAETPTHVITMAFDPDLDDCVVVALRAMLDLIERCTALKRHEAYMLASLAADLRVTQVVNEYKGIHVMLEKRYLQPPR
ncbi:MAG: acetamidase/formamidase family protein [Xanthobacteraceae bacterium]|nr:acetamidase/formamidase family protein [Xanthobacteraceae bacterium]